MSLRLGVNIDHVATVRNARGSAYPDPLRAAAQALEAGADGVTAHLREDRRHITDGDIAALSDLLSLAGRPLNFEMAVTEEMIAIAMRHRPHAACLVPERREERTTEGGLEVARDLDRITAATFRLTEAGMRVSHFIEADPRQIEAAHRAGAAVVEIHTGRWCERVREGDDAEARAQWDRIAAAVRLCGELGMECHAGHGLDYGTAEAIASLDGIAELNIGHFLIGEAIFVGLDAAVRAMRDHMAKGVARRRGGRP